MVYETLIPLLTFLAVSAIGGAWIVARSLRRESIVARLRAGQDELDAEVLDGGKRRSPLVQALESLAAMLAPGAPSAKLGEQLARAGYYGRSAPAVYLGLKMVLGVAGLVAVGLAASQLEAALPLRVMATLCAGGALFFLPNIVVSMRRDARRQEVRDHLPDAVDLLEVCVSAGMGLDMAWNAVAQEIRRVSSVLADEMLLTNLEIHLGAQRAQAMRHMSERTGVDELSSLVAVLVQSERFGTSMSDALRTFAQSMRETRSQRAEEVAEKMSVKLLFPLVVFIFPTILIVTAGPAAIKIAQMFTMSRG